MIRDMSLRSALYYVILILPAFILIVVILSTARDLHAIRRANPQDIYRTLLNHSSKPISFPMPDSIYVRKQGATLIYVFGASSLAISDGNTFPYYLNEGRDNLHVVNLGVDGINSVLLRQRVAEALKIARPDIIVLYFGHNDYNNVYQGIVMPRYFDKFHLLLWPSQLINMGSRKPCVLEYDEYYWYSRLTRPRLIKLFESLGLIEIRQDQYEPINKYILDKYVTHSTAIMDLAASKGIPIVFITPIGNLRAEPFGDIDTTTKLYDRGMKESNYRESIGYLKAAKDKEIFTYDLRAKAPLVNYIRNMQIANVYALDLERQLEDSEFEFGYSNFLDYFHFNDSTHRIVADAIYRFIKEKNLIDARE